MKKNAIRDAQILRGYIISAIEKIQCRWWINVISRRREDMLVGFLFLLELLLMVSKV